MPLPLNWRWLVIDGWKSHAVPEYLESVLVGDLAARQPPDDDPAEVQSHPIVSMGIDMPGMVCTTRPWMTFHIDGLDIEIPCEDVASFLLQLNSLKPREFTHEKAGAFKGLSYYKLHGFCKCIVLTPDLKVMLTEALEAGVAEAEAQATAFWADKKLPSEILREANAAANNIPLDEVPDCGAHKQDRFRLTKKGEA